MSQTHPKSFRDHKWDLFQFISGDLDPNKQRIRKQFVCKQTYYNFLHLQPFMKRSDKIKESL